MSLYGFFDDGKTESGSFLIFATGKISFVKTFPDLIQCISRNTDTVILDRRVNFIATLGCLDRNGRILITEFDRIIDQIIKNLLDLPLVCKDIEMFGCEKKFNRNLFLGSAPFKGCGYVFDYLMNIE